MDLKAKSLPLNLAIVRKNGTDKLSKKIEKIERDINNNGVCAKCGVYCLCTIIEGEKITVKSCESNVGQSLDGELFKKEKDFFGLTLKEVCNKILEEIYDHYGIVSSDDKDMINFI